jgi:hypothetical protein
MMRLVARIEEATSAEALEPGALCSAHLVETHVCTISGS